MASVIPKDTYVISCGVFYLLGVIIMVPYFFYINAFDFWMYKFEKSLDLNQGSHAVWSIQKVTDNSSNVSLNMFVDDKNGLPRVLSDFQQSVDTSIKNNNDGKNNTSPEKRNRFQVNVTSALSLNFQSLMLFGLVFMLLYCKKLPPPEKRLAWCLCSLSIIFPASIIITQIKAIYIVPVFFSMAMVLTTLLNCISGIAMASLFEIITKFPPNCVIFLLCGNSICGMAAGILRIVLIPTHLKPDRLTAIYFSVGSVIMITITTYYWYVAKTSKSFIYRIEEKKTKDQNKLLKRLNLLKMMNKAKWYYASIFVAYGSTHVVHPGLTILVVPTVSEGVWKNIYFVNVITLFGFYGFLFLGQELSRIIKNPKNGLILFVISLLRISFVPLLIFCNAQPRQYLPVFFEDQYYIIFMILFAVTEGILIVKSVIGMILLFEGDEKKAAMVFVTLVMASAFTVGSIINVCITNLI